MHGLCNDYILVYTCIDSSFVRRGVGVGEAAEAVVEGEEALDEEGDEGEEAEEGTRRSWLSLQSPCITEAAAADAATEAAEAVEADMDGNKTIATRSLFALSHSLIAFYCMNFTIQ